MSSIFEKNRTFIIAELSANHNHKLSHAIKVLKAAQKAGADAVKVQTYTPETLTIDCDRKPFRIEHPKWGGQTLYELYAKAYMPWKWYPRLKEVADDLGLILFSTAFDPTAVDFLEEHAVPIHKIASFEIVDLPLVRYAAAKKKPLIISTGMASIGEISDALEIARKAGAKDVTLLKCVSCYPAKPEDMNLRTIAHMKEMFQCRVGLSDHTLGSGAAVVAVSMGAQVIEKHFTLSRKIETPDSFFSMEPEEFRDMVKNVRIAEKALGNVHYGRLPHEKNSMVFRRSLYYVKNISKGATVTMDDVRSIRPAGGLSPKHMDQVIGHTVKRNVQRGEPVAWSDFV